VALQRRSSVCKAEALRGLKPAVQSGFPIRHDEPKIIALRALVFFLHEGRDKREQLNVLVLILTIALVVGLAWRGNVKP
jgi:hypothetical protein